MLLHLCENFDRERIHCGSLHLVSKSDLTPEEQETMQKSNDPSVIMTATGTSHATGEATIHVCDLDMFVQGHFVTESPAALSLGYCAKKTVTRMNGIQVSHENRL